MGNFLSRMFGSRNDRLIKKLGSSVDSITALEAKMAELDDEALSAKTAEFRQRLAAGEAVDALLPEAFATVREAGKRVMGMRHFDVQLIGGMVLNDGKIAEMRTGEGKTLVATLPVYLNALPGKGVHVVTVNDYLARRDAEWMGKLYGFLGMTTGVVVSEQSAEEKRAAYAADITYGTNNEFGFDYLRDNMAFSTEDKVQRDLTFAVIDEVDSILIDEARTPLIISGPTDTSSNLYAKINELIPELVEQKEEDGPGDYSLEEKSRQVYLTESGHEHVEVLFEKVGLIGEGESLYDSSHITLMHLLSNALRANALFKIDDHYIIKNNEIVIVDEFTGRTMPGRRWSDGLHQAVEAKEGVAIQQENQTLAAITFQNYFRLYDKLSGMTGTADTEAFEFNSIYGLEVVMIPTNKKMARDDRTDLVYLNTEDKFNAIADDIKDCQSRGQPVLVGTSTIETSEKLSNLLKKEKIKHEVLNAKQHEREADIVAQAGSPKAVTIATNMAGRGTDIVLGGNLEVELTAAQAAGKTDSELEAIRADWQIRHQQVLEFGGLHIVGTERHESRRIDNQLRGRSGRQGDVGSTRFYLSLEDSLMRIFASEKVGNLMQKLGMEDGEAIEHPWVTKAIENAQRKVEGHNFDTRKQLLEYDDVANDQRNVIYEQRNDLMAGDDISDSINVMREDVVNSLINEFIAPQSLDEQWDIPGLEKALETRFSIKMDVSGWLDADDSLHEETLREKILDKVVATYQEKEERAGAEVIRHFEKAVMLQILDSQWKEHLAAMDHLRQGIHLRGYAQKNPKQEYKRESFEMFTELLENIKRDVIGILSKVVVKAEDVQAVEEKRRTAPPMQFEHAESSAVADASDEVEPEQDEREKPSSEKTEPFVRQGRKVGRNEPCPCGSGKKYKQCHGKVA